MPTAAFADSACPPKAEAAKTIRPYGSHAAPSARARHRVKGARQQVRLLQLDARKIPRPASEKQTARSRHLYRQAPTHRAVTGRMKDASVLSQRQNHAASGEIAIDGHR